MSISVCAVASCLLSLLGLATSAAAQADDLLRRLRSLCEDMEAAAKTTSGELSDADLDLLEQAQIDRDSVPDVASILVMLRFGATLRDEDFARVIEFGASKEGGAIAWPLQMLCVIRGRMDGAARLTTAWLLEAPRDNRRYMTWKLFETLFGSRDDYPRLSFDFGLALLRRFEQGDEQEQRVVRDVLEKPDLTREQVADLLETAEVRWRKTEKELREMAKQIADAEPAMRYEKLWVEDRKGLREVPVNSLRRVDRFEIRLQTGAGEPWGTLLVYDEYDPEVVMAKLTALRLLAESARDDGKDLGEGRGPIAVVLRNEEPWESRSRIQDLDHSVTLALATAELLRLRVAFELPRDPVRDERAVARAKALLGAVRGGARRVRELTNTAAQNNDAAAAADATLLRILRDATGDAMALCGELTAGVPAPAPDAGWRDMEIAETKNARSQRRGRTRVWVDADTVRVLFVDVCVVVDERTERARDVMGSMTFALRREDLRDAEFNASDDGSLELKTTRPVLITWADVCLATSDIARSRVGSCLRARLMRSVGIPCDTAAHRDELIAALRKFATGEGR